VDLPTNLFKRAISSGRTPLGAWLGSGAPSTAEALGCAGFDFLVVDMEHTPIDTPQMIDILRAIAGTPAQAIVRPPWNDMVMVKRALDAGAQTLLLPFVQNADEARRAVAYTRYPPEGVRGVAGTHRGSRYGTVSNYLKVANTEICVIVQIETLPALDRLDEIAAVPGIDSIFVGPSDLSASMGHLGDVGHAAVQEHLAAAAKACQRAGKPCGIIGPTPDMVARFIDYGYSWIAIGSDMGFMVGRAQEYLGRFRDASPTAGQPAPAR
jgi:2-dehydro-3-deoxyglucarate aldolase/4-hydroxy-2-oxoheptanedioate aldolase